MTGGIKWGVEGGTITGGIEWGVVSRSSEGGTGGSELRAVDGGSDHAGGALGESDCVVCAWDTQQPGPGISG